MPLNYDQIQNYMANLVPERPDELQKMEAYADEHNFPIVGPVAGQLCYQVARMIKAKSVFELGSGYGYSTAWFARAVQENGGGIVHHVVWDETLSQMARQHLTALGYESLIQYHVSEAVQQLRQTEGPFDLIFNDINKDAYPESLDVIETKLRPGGVLIIDNMFLNGQIFLDDTNSASYQGVKSFTDRISSDPNWLVTLAPVRDGLIVAYKRA